MRSRDIIDLYDRVHIGTHVLITPRRIHDFVKPEEPDLLAQIRLRTPISERRHWLASVAAVARLDRGRETHFV